jgi:16S rRNA (uracil1498-N3)-methyltransferase
VTSHRRPDTLFWVDPDNLRGDAVTLDPDESHHLLRVHRAEPGAPFEATDGGGVLLRCRLAAASDGIARGEVIERIAGAGELPGEVRLLVGIPDVRAIESVVEHAVPLGVTALVFVACERSGPASVGGSRLERLGRLAVAGVKQSRRCLLPAILTARSLGEALEPLVEELRLVADPAGRPLPPPSAGPGATSIAAAVGPPGGFTDRESELLRRSGFAPISLGNSRLTTETAAIALLCGARNLLTAESLRAI